MSARFSLRRNQQPPPRPSVPEEVAVGPPGNGALEYGYRAGAAGEQDTAGYELAGAYDGAAESGYENPEDVDAVYDGDPTLYDPEGYVEDDESWLAPDTRRRVKLAVPTFALGALVVIAGAFWGGAEVDKHFGNHNSTTAAGLAAALGRRASSFSGSGAGGGFAGLGGSGGGTTGGGFGGGGFGGSTPAASGTVSAISGRDLTVTSTAGTKTTVVLTSSTIVTRIGEGSAGALKVGDTIRVQGTKASDGTVTASSVTATAAGVSRGGFAGLGGAGGAGSATVGGGASTGGSTTQTTVKNGGFSGDGAGVSS